MFEAVFSNFGFVDVIFGLFLFYGLFIGFVQGLSRQLPKFISLLFGVGAALIAYEWISEYIAENTLMNQSIIESAIVFTLSIMLSLFTKFFFMLITKVISFQFVYFFERILGALFGGLRLAFFFSFISYVILLWPTDFFVPYYQDLSYLGTYIEEVIPIFKDYTDPIRDFIFSKVEG